MRRHVCHKFEGQKASFVAQGMNSPNIKMWSMYCSEYFLIFHFSYSFSHVFRNSCSTVFCPIAGCGAHLDCLEEFEDHYVTRHTASCSVCSRVYPTSRLLSIHVSEAHDSYFQVKVARGFPMVIVICLFYILANCRETYR